MYMVGIYPLGQNLDCASLLLVFYLLLKALLPSAFATLDVRFVRKSPSPIELNVTTFEKSSYFLIPVQEFEHIGSISSEW